VEHDLLKRLVGPVLTALRALLATTAMPDPIRAALAQLLEASGLIAVAGVLAALGILGSRETTAPAQHGNPVRQKIAVASGVAAVALGLWLLRHPSTQFDDLFARWDHLAFAGLVGLALTTLPAAQRKWCLAAVSLGMLLQYAGLVAVGLVGGFTVIGVALLHTRIRSNLRLTIVLQVALAVAVYGITFWLRRRDFTTAARLQGLLTFWLLRHISLIVSALQTGPPALADCAAFIAFYPGAMGWLGAPEVYGEFARRNLVRPATVNHRKAARRVAEGVLLFAAARLVPVSLQRVETSATALEAWACGILLFVKTALGGMGAWRWVEGTALFYGVRMRVNFGGLLSCRNPSELWWAWRGTLTNWLVQHIYAPLGANRRHQSLNIVAVFTASFLWHALGVPFLTTDFRLGQVTALALWVGVNGTAVIAHVNADRLGLLKAPGAIPACVRVAVKIVLIWALGSLTPILLHYQGAAVERLPNLLRLLLGLR